MIPICIGLASGLGNCVYMLPTIKALKLMGHSVYLQVQTDFPTGDLWRRCVYVDGVFEPPADPGDHRLLAGQYKPPAWNGHIVKQYRLPAIHDCEWRSNFRLAVDEGWGDAPPDVSDWCDGLDRTPRWDIGIVPGCKGGTWLRKRYPAMKDVAAFYLAQGKTVAVFGQDRDGIGEIPGRAVITPNLALLPDALAGCKVVIGTDSGVTHLASSLGVPVVMVYTATSGIKAEPVGQPNRRIATELNCYPCVSTPKWQMCHEWKCQNIEIENVISAADELFEATL